MRDINFDNLLCAIDTETTGLNPDMHEIVQLAVIPLGADLQPHPHYPPLNVWISPTEIDNVDPESLSITGKSLDDFMGGLDAGLAADLFTEWVGDLNLKPKSLIMPVAHNWAFDSQFIRNWLGRETFDMIFHGFVRDTMAMGLALDDLAWAYGEELPFPRLKLREMCTTAGIQVPAGPHDAVRDATMTMELYRFMCFNRTLTRNQQKG